MQSKDHRLKPPTFFVAVKTSNISRTSSKTPVSIHLFYTLRIICWPNGRKLGWDAYVRRGVQVHVSRSVHGFYSKNKGSINLKKKETRNVNFKSMETLLNKICTLRDF